jgi:hypothetical protein
MRAAGWHPLEPFELALALPPPGPVVPAGLLVPAVWRPVRWPAAAAATLAAEGLVAPEALAWGLSALADGFPGAAQHALLPPLVAAALVGAASEGWRRNAAR